MAISQRINAERLMLVAWPRAILLQIAHPLVAAGVAGHSSFRQNPATAARRLHSTVRAMLSLSFGDRDEQARAIDGIRAIHRRVNGALNEAVGPYAAGTRYSAEDPALLLWVHATLLESIVLAYDALVAPLSTADRDAYVDDAAWVAIALGARPGEVPRTWAALERWLRETLQSGDIVVGTTARDLAPSIATWGMRNLTAGWLPAGIRAQYGYAWTDQRARRSGALLRLLRAARRPLPRAVAWWPEARVMVKPRGRETG